MDVKALQARLAAFAVERGWDEMHNPRNLAIALAGEAGMLLDLFRWLTDAQSQRIESEYKREAAEEAIADLLLHTLRLADKLDIDVERAVAKKLAENDANYPPPVAETVPRAERPAAAPPVVSAPEPPPAAAQVPLPAKKEISAPVEQKRATPAAESAPTPAAKEPKPAVEPPKPSPDKALPSWLDGIMPARSATTRKKLSPAAKPPAAPPKVPESPRAPKPPSPPLAARAVGEIEATSPPVAAEPEPIEPTPPPPPPPPPEPERYAFLDTDAAKGFVKSLAKRVDSARSDDPLLRELHDEVETLRRTLYSPTPKRSWMGDTLKTIRAVLEEAATHSVGEEIRAADYIAQIDRMLGP